MKSKPKQRFTYPELDFTDFTFNYEKPWEDDSSNSCCGVLEIGDIKEGKIVIEIQPESDDSDYGDDLITYPNGGHPPVKKATYKEILKAFKKFLEYNKKHYGIVVCYLLPGQQSGDFGKLLKGSGFTDHGTFWNPKTRHTLHHWSKVLHSRGPRKSKTKSILRRR